MIIKGRLTYNDFKKYYAYYALKNYSIKFMAMFIAFLMINTGLSIGKRLNIQNEILFTLILSFLMSSAIIIILIIIFFSILPVGYFIFGVKPAPYNKRANKNFVSLADFNNKFRIIDTQTIQNPLYFLKYWAYFIKLCARDTQHSSKFTFR